MIKSLQMRLLAGKWLTGISPFWDHLQEALAPWASLLYAPCQLWHSRIEKAHCPMAISSQIRTSISSVMRQRIFRHGVCLLFFFRVYLMENVPALNFPFSPQIITAFTEGSASAFFRPFSNAWRTVKLKEIRDSVSNSWVPYPSKRSVINTVPVKMSCMSKHISPLACLLPLPPCVNPFISSPLTL